MKMAEDEKNKVLNDLSETISELQQKIKDEIKEKKEGVEEQIKNLIENATQIAKYLSYKVCDFAEMDHQECRNDKKNCYLIYLELLRRISENVL